MSALETALHWLRPVVESKTWDYCVVWKLGDDPSRFIQWVGCCCSGACGDPFNVKEESEDHQHQLLPLCRDTKIKHSAKTKACQKLALFPSSMALYSGIQGEAVMSTEARWYGCTKDSKSSDHSHESTGTEVLIPVVNGLIELFSSKHIPKDEKFVDYITSQFITMEREGVTAQSHSTFSLSKQPHDPLLGEYSNNLPAPLHSLNLIPRLPFLPRVSQTATYPFFEGSSTGSSPSNHHSSFCSGSSSGHVSPNVSVNESIEKYPTSIKPGCNRNLSSKQEFGILGHAVHLVEKDHLKSRQRIEREQFQSKNLVTERKRRNRIKDGLFTLRALVPKISKMDRASILGDAIEYIEDLQKEVKKLQDELGEMEKEECKEENNELMPRLNSTEHNQDLPSVEENEQMEVQVETNQIGTRNFLLKLLCKQQRGGFRGLIEAVNSLGLQVIDANVTTFNGKVLNILQVEVNKMGVQLQPKSLRDSLIKLLTTRRHLKSTPS